MKRLYAELNVMLVVALAVATLATAIPVASAATSLLRDGVLTSFL